MNDKSLQTLWRRRPSGAWRPLKSWEAFEKDAWKAPEANIAKISHCPYLRCFVRPPKKSASTARSRGRFPGARGGRVTAQPTAACGTGSSVARRRVLGSGATSPASVRSPCSTAPGSLSLGLRGLGFRGSRCCQVSYSPRMVCPGP